MVTPAPAHPGTEPEYNGLRCTADEYLALPDDGFAYQLIDGVILMSPKPTPQHQDVLAEIVYQLMAHVRMSRQGRVLPEVDVRLSAELVYSPDVVYLAEGRVVDPKKALTAAPDVAIEIISPSSRRMDLKTKRADYEKYGVREYWVIEPEDQSVRVLRLRDGVYIETVCGGASAASEVIPGFAFDLGAIRAAMRA